MSDAEAPIADADLDSDDVVTVATLNGEIATVIEDRVDLHHDYIIGDVSDCTESNGHVHFDLVYDDASIHCVLFGFRRNGTSTEPVEELQVAVRGDLSYYEEGGSCSLLVTDVVEMGKSQYSRVHEENRAILTEDGLLDDEQKQSLPELPGTVGLVTSMDSDARTDAETALHDRYPKVNIKIQHASVQGSNALQELMSAVSRLDEDAAVEVIVVTRGGGADKTLRVFNETPLCRVIARTETPIAVGIGHEEDTTLADEVADRRIMTPTEAGVVVPERAAIERDIAQLETDLNTAYTTTAETRLAAFATALDTAYGQTVSADLQDLESSLTHAAERQIETELLELQTRLDTAHEAVEREKEHEAELAESVKSAREAATADVQAEIEATRRRYRIIVAAVVLLALLLLVFYIL